MRSKVYAYYNVTTGERKEYRYDIDRYNYACWVHHHYQDNGVFYHTMIKFVSKDLKTLFHDAMHSCRSGRWSGQIYNSRVFHFATFRIFRINGTWLCNRVMFYPDAVKYVL